MPVFHVRSGLLGTVLLLGLCSGAAFAQNLEGLDDPAAPSAPAQAPPLLPPETDEMPFPVLEDSDSEPGPVAVEEIEGIEAPSPEVLDRPGRGAVMPVPETESNEIPAITIAPREDTGDDLFFDADTLVPTGEMGSSEPRKVDPAAQPASRLIVVRKSAEADSASAQLVSATRAMKLGLYEAALDMYENLYQKNKRDPRILMGRAVTLQHLGYFDAAMQTYEELLEIDKNNIEAKVNMLGLLGTKYPAVALRRLTELRQDHPNHVGIVAQLAVMHAQTGNVQDAMRYLGIAASMEPANANHVYNMAVIADRAGSTKEAIKYYEQALEVDTIYGRGQSIPRDSVYERLARIR